MMKKQYPENNMNNAHIIYSRLLTGKQKTGKNKKVIRYRTNPKIRLKTVHLSIVLTEKFRAGYRFHPAAFSPVLSLTH